MFDRAFFEQHFLEQLRNFARERKVTSPVVEFLLDDGTIFYIRSILQTKEGWFCLSVHDADGARQVYCPYYSIKRITLHARAPKGAASPDVGFQLG